MDRLPRTEVITKGEKWGLQIGSRAVEVYERLQELDVEQQIGGIDVMVPSRQNNSSEIGPRILSEPFDPQMADFNEWLYYTFKDVRPGISGRSKVMLQFQDGKLRKIVHEYKEFEVYND